MLLMLSAAIGLSSSLFTATPACRAASTASVLRRGLVLYDSYNGPAAAEAFKGAARSSPRCAAAYLGLAIAEGPNLNFPATKVGFARAARAARAALELRRNATPVQREIIEALTLRYGGDFSGYERNERRYVDALRRLAAGNGKHNDDVAMLLCEALLEDRNGPALWTREASTQRAEIRELLAGVLKRTPSHLMANHLAIHFHDFDPDRSAALPYANRLSWMKLEPAAEHLVHMSAHAYSRAGRYNEAIDASMRALTLSRHAAHPLYYTHDYFVGLGAAFMGNDYGKAVRLIKRFCPDTSATCRETRVMAAVRFGKWSTVVEMTGRRSDPLSLLLLTRALLAKGHTARAYATFGRLSSIAPRLAESPNDTTIAVAISRGDRAKTLALARGLELEKAREMPEMLPLFPAREMQGRAFLAAGDAHDARVAFLDDFRAYPCNVRAAVGLREAAVRGKGVPKAPFCRTPVRYADGARPEVRDF